MSKFSVQLLISTISGSCFFVWFDYQDKKFKFLLQDVISKTVYQSEQIQAQTFSLQFFRSEGSMKKELIVLKAVFTASGI